MGAVGVIADTSTGVAASSHPAQAASASATVLVQSNGLVAKQSSPAGSKAVESVVMAA